MKTWTIEIDESIHFLRSFKDHKFAFLPLEEEIQKGDIVILYSKDLQRMYSLKTSVDAIFIRDAFYQSRFDNIFERYFVDKEKRKETIHLAHAKLSLLGAAKNQLVLEAIKRNEDPTRLFEPKNSGLTTDDYHALGITGYEDALKDLEAVYWKRKSLGLFLLDHSKDKDFCDSLHLKAMKVLERGGKLDRLSKDAVLVKASLAMIAINFYKGNFWDEVFKRYHSVFEAFSLKGDLSLNRKGWESNIRNLLEMDETYIPGMDYISVPIQMAIVQAHFIKEFYDFVWKVLFENQLGFTSEIDDQESIASVVESFLKSLTECKDEEEAAQGNLLLYEGGRQARFKISKYSVNVLTHGFYFNDTKDLIIQIVNRMIDHRYYHDSRTPSLSPFFEESFREWVKGKERGRKYDPDRARSDRGSEDSYRIFKPKLILGRDYHVFIRIPSNDFPSDFDRSNINIEVYDSEDTAIVSFGPGDLKIYDLIGSQKKYRVLCNRLIPLKNAIGGFRYRYYSTDDFKYEKRRYLFFNENGNEVFPNRDFEGICYALTPVPITGVEKQMEFQDPEEKFWVSCFAVDPKTVIRVGEELLFFNSADRLGIRCEPYRNIEGVTGEKNSFKVYREIDSFSFETTKMISDIKLHLDDTEVSLDSPAFSDSGEVLEINSGKEGIHRFLINLKNPLLPGFHKMWLFEKDGGTLIESLGLEDRMFAVDPDLTIESSFENEEVFVSGTTIQPQRLTFDLQEEEKIVPGSLGVHAYNFKNPLLRYCWDDESPNRVVGAQVHSSILERHIFLNVFSNSPSLTAKLVDTISGKEKEWQVVARDGCFKLYIPEARDFVENHAIVDLSLTSDDTTATIRFFSVPFPLSQGFGFALKPLEDPAKRVLEIEGSYCGEGKILLKVFKEGKEDPLLKLPIQNDDKEKKNFGSNVKGLSPNTLWTVQLVGETEPDPFSRQGVLSAVVFEKKINWGSFACLKVGLLYAIVTADWDDGSGNSGTYNYLVADEARRYCATLRIISLDLDKKICKAYAYDTNFCKEERLGLLELALQEESEGKTCVFEIRRQDGGPVFAHGNGLLDNTWSALNKRVKSIEMMNSGNTLEGWKERRKNHVK